MATENALRPLLIDELRDLLDAERQLTRALPKMARAASSTSLKKAFEKHLRETEGHIARLEQALTALDASVRGKPCAGMKGLISEGQEMMSELSGEPVRDAALIVSAQKVEHYEIAAYGSCKAFAELLGEQRVARLVAATLAEEKATDEALTALATGQVNPKASDAAAEDNDVSAGIFSRASEWIRDTMSNTQAAIGQGRKQSARATNDRKAAGRRRTTTGSRSSRGSQDARKK
jgi:ferritin-like metal-binding protein YciE